MGGTASLTGVGMMWIAAVGATATTVVAVGSSRTPWIRVALAPGWAMPVWQPDRTIVANRVAISGKLLRIRAMGSRLLAPYVACGKGASQLLPFLPEAQEYGDVVSPIGQHLGQRGITVVVLDGEGDRPRCFAKIP